MVEVDPPYGVVPDTVTVALELHAASIQGSQGLPGVQERLAVQGDFRDIPRGAPAAQLHLPPMLRGAPEVPGLLGSPEGPVLDILEALLALSLPSGTKLLFRVCPTATELPSMLWAAVVKRPTEGSILLAGKGGWGDFEGGRLCQARSEAVVPETEGPDPACGVGLIIDGTLHAFHSSGRGELGVDVPPAEHRAL